LRWRKFAFTLSDMTPRRFLSIITDCSLAIALGVVLAAVLFYGWSGEFRPWA
jgi:hypothetical protein